MSVFLTPSLFTMTGAKTQPVRRKAVSVDALQDEERATHQSPSGQTRANSKAKPAWQKRHEQRSQRKTKYDISRLTRYGSSAPPAPSP